MKEEHKKYVQTCLEKIAKALDKALFPKTCSDLYDYLEDIRGQAYKAMEYIDNLTTKQCGCEKCQGG